MRLWQPRLMILIGQYDSPFVRRVGIALTLYDVTYEHKPWSVFGDWREIAPYNPLTRVPTLVLDNGEVLIESHAMLDYLDDLVGEDRAMFPAHGAERYRAIKVAALATGAADKAVSMFYEKRLHVDGAASALWIERCQRQINGALAELESLRGSRNGGFITGARLGHADIAIACACRFITEAHPGLIDMAQYPELAAQNAKLEALPVFNTIRQVFIPPA
jgi:glutathione S-transferase